MAEKKSRPPMVDAVLLVIGWPEGITGPVAVKFLAGAGGPVGMVSPGKEPVDGRRCCFILIFKQLNVNFGGDPGGFAGWFSPFGYPGCRFKSRNKWF